MGFDGHTTDWTQILSDIVVGIYKCILHCLVASDNLSYSRENPRSWIYIQSYAFNVDKLIY